MYHWTNLIGLVNLDEQELITILKSLYLVYNVVPRDEYNTCILQGCQNDATDFGETHAASVI